MRIRSIVSLFVFLFCLFMTQKNAYCNPISIIRDTEIEEYALKNIRILFDAAGLRPENAQVVLINDPTLNAFVAGGSTVFIHTGLIIEADNSDEFVGVLAHEVGHVVGGHTVSLYAHLEKAQTTAIITTILGGIAAIASGRADVGVAIMAGGMGSTQGLVNAYRQTEENAADSTALRLLAKTDSSPAGLTLIMKKIQAAERLQPTSPFSYMRSHPLTRDRIDFLNHAGNQNIPLKDDPEYRTIRAKLFAFLETPEQTFSRFGGPTYIDLYARAIAEFKRTNIPESLRLTDMLIKNDPQNPYYYELRGQILFESGQISPSVDAYRKAFLSKPNAVLIRLSLAHALIETEDPKNIPFAISHLEFITSRDKYLPDAWRFLSIAYGRAGRFPESEYALAEYYALIGDKREAFTRINKARKTLDPQTPQYQRLLDIEDYLRK